MAVAWSDAFSALVRIPEFPKPLLLGPPVMPGALPRARCLELYQRRPRVGLRAAAGKAFPEVRQAQKPVPFPAQSRMESIELPAV